ncbi:MAG TPA: sialidase family protein, partial [Nevskiaceae bacterium]|nr:sialidase family protein [Nevskiaceae bacterium]
MKAIHLRSAVLTAAALSLAGCGSGSDSVLPATAGTSPVLHRLSGPNALPEACRALAAESNPQLVVHEDDPQQISAVYLQDGIIAVVGAASRDDGQSWARSPIVDATACAGGPAEREVAVNPLLGSGAAQRVYFGQSFGGTAAHVADQAQGPWRPAVAVPSPRSENLNLLGSSTDPDRVVALWTHFETLPGGLPRATELRAAVSTDNGLSYSPPVVAATTVPGRLIVNGRLARVAPDQLLAVYDTARLIDLPLILVASQALEFQLQAIRSPDGLNWTAPVALGASRFLPLFDPEGRQTPGVTCDALGNCEVAGSYKFDLAVGPRGEAAVVWADLREGDEGVLRMITSADGGESWTPPFDALTRSAPLFQPAVAIDAEGRLGLFWYDWTGDQPGDEPLSTDAWFASSTDGGQRWAIRHLAGPYDLRASYDPRATYDFLAIGVYQDLVARPDGFGAAFT